eukprot:SAG31_NODE_16243_length_717_cov_0.914239_1_plen_142_part_10
MLDTLPAELLASAILSCLDARALGQVAVTNRAVHRLATADEAWRPLLLLLGFTAQGLRLWQESGAAAQPGRRAPSLMQLFALADRYHEALEFEVLSHRNGHYLIYGHYLIIIIRCIIIINLGALAPQWPNFPRHSPHRRPNS